LHPGKYNGKRNVVFVQVNDVPVNIPKRETKPRQGLTATVEVIHASHRLVKDHLSMLSGHRDLLYYVPIPCHTHRVKVSQPSRRHVNVPERVQVNVPANFIAVIERFQEFFLKMVLMVLWATEGANSSTK
jgi:hypothetical protein